MRKGDIWLINLNPSMGREQSGIRPVVIISGNGMNDYLKLSIVCPLTTQIKNFIGSVILLPTSKNGLDRTSEVLSFQIRTVTHKRFIKKIGFVEKEQMEELTTKINKIFKY